MARPLRVEYEGAFYHVTARGNERRAIFETGQDYGRFKFYLIKAQNKHGFILHGYVLMPNHYHLIIETPKANLRKIMHYLNTSYTAYFNRKMERSGHLFQGRYKAILVDADQYLLELSRYLHLNPARAHLVKNPVEYLYSSYHSYIQVRREGIVHRDLIWGMISGAGENPPKRYRRFVEAALRKEMESPLRNVYGGLILGGEKFVQDTLRKIERKDLQKRDISHRRQLKMVNGIEAIMKAVCSHFGVTRGAIVKDRRWIRKIAIYLSKKHTGLTNREIGEMFGNISYSAITRVYQRLEEMLPGDKELEKQMRSIEAILSNVKG